MRASSVTCTGNTSSQSDTGFTLSGGVGSGSFPTGTAHSGRFTLYGVNSTNYKDFLGNATDDSVRLPTISMYLGKPTRLLLLLTPFV